MIQKKICLLGAFAAGKTSLVAQYVHSMFSEKYQTTLGVKVDKKQINVHGHDTTLLIWDLAGEDDLVKLPTSYLRGASGCLLVVDGTRPRTGEVALGLRRKMLGVVPDAEFVAAVNKVDLQGDWAFDDSGLSSLAELGGPVLTTSAKTGKDVEELFAALAVKMLTRPGNTT